jgi:thioredoxin-related protein
VYDARRGRFVLLAVAVSSAKDPVGYAKENKLTLDFARDTGGGAQLYNVRGIPTTFFIDRRGRIVEKVVGGLDKAGFEEKLAKIL